MVVDIGTVDCFVASSGPAGALAKPVNITIVNTTVETSPNRNALVSGSGSGTSLKIEVALEAQVGIALGEHFLVCGSVRTVARCAALAGCLVWEHERSHLLGMALEAGLISTSK